MKRTYTDNTHTHIFWFILSSHAVERSTCAGIHAHPQTWTNTIPSLAWSKNSTSAMYTVTDGPYVVAVERRVFCPLVGEKAKQKERKRESLCDSWWIYARDQLSTECSSRSLWYTTHAHPVDTKTISERVEQWGAIRVRRVEHTIESEHSQLRNVTCESGKSMIEKMFARIANMRIWQVASDKVVGEYTCWLLHHDFQTN